jgi:hypothetical protein
MNARQAFHGYELPASEKKTLSAYSVHTHPIERTSQVFTIPMTAIQPLKLTHQAKTKGYLLDANNLQQLLR